MRSSTVVRQVKHVQLLRTAKPAGPGGQAPALVVHSVRMPWPCAVQLGYPSNIQLGHACTGLIIHISALHAIWASRSSKGDHRHGTWQYWAPRIFSTIEELQIIPPFLPAGTLSTSLPAKRARLKDFQQNRVDALAIQDGKKRSRRFLPCTVRSCCTCASRSVVRASIAATANTALGVPAEMLIPAVSPASNVAVEVYATTASLAIDVSTHVTPADLTTEVNVATASVATVVSTHATPSDLTTDVNVATASVAAPSVPHTYQTYTTVVYVAAANGLITKPLSGIRNHKNMCGFITLLQCLYSIPLLVQFLDSRTKLSATQWAASLTPSWTLLVKLISHPLLCWLRHLVEELLAVSDSKDSLRHIHLFNTLEDCMASAYGRWDALCSGDYLECNACNDSRPSVMRVDPKISHRACTLAPVDSVTVQYRDFGK